MSDRSDKSENFPSDRMFPDLDSIAAEVFDLLRRTSHRLVLAESCTAGLIAATLGRIPGVSAVLVGSAVVYQVETKAVWLKISRGLLENPGPVSQEVAEAMASGVLAMTPHGSVALSITGHLGPDAPSGLDGVAWTAVAFRGGFIVSQRLSLCANDDGSSSGTACVAALTAARHRRQTDAVRQALLLLRHQLQQVDGSA